MVHTVANDLPARAKAVGALAAEHADYGDKHGRLADAVVEALHREGLLGIWVPRVLGGAELDPISSLQVIEQVAYGDPSAGWVLMAAALAIGTGAAYLDEDAAVALFSGPRVPVIAGQGTRPGVARPVDGGFRLTGSWSFASGIKHGTHIHTLGLVEGTNEARIFVLPVEQVTLLDNWDVMGLRATGSNDIVVEDAFVPEHRTLCELDMFNLQCPGNPDHPAGLYRIPFAQIFNRTVSTTSLGTLKRALDTFVEATREKRATYTGERLARDTTIQFAVAEVERILDEQTLVLDRDARELLQHAQDNTWTLERRAALGASTTTTVSRCVRAIDILMEFSGAKALFRGNVIQQAFLDIHCARAHVANNPYPYGRNLGAVRFGFPNESSDI